jgi:hypothetical protein
MQAKFRTAFLAFPAKPDDLVSTITAGASAANDTEKIAITQWPEMDIFGACLADKVRDEIRKADVLVCDVTLPNYNVYYETGFAIGAGKPIAPVINRAFADAQADILKDGFFDGIGYRTYENSEQLEAILFELPPHALLQLYAKPINFQQPLFVLDTLRKTDFRNAIVSAVKASKVFFRSFDPVEVSRFSTVPIIGDSSASSGVIVPLLAPHVEDAHKHNLRAAFLAGISHGLGRLTLLVQRDNDPVPVDFRDFVLSVKNEAEIGERVGEFAKTALVATQSLGTVAPRSQKTALQKLSLGASSAENEFRTLENYFVETAEYLRTIRGEVRVVAGRKGSGKTAIFFRARDSFRALRESFVIDLKPESHQLSLFREELLKITGAGVFDHTLAAFWYFVLLSEILLIIREEYEFRAKRDQSALAVTREIDEAFEKFGSYQRGDFTSRINRLGSIIVQEIKALNAAGTKLTPERLTNIVFRDGISKIRELIELYTTNRTSMVLLFDNIDKGWLSQGVHEFDVRLVRLLIESLDKIRRDFDAKDRDFVSVVFLRNDIYELLIGQTPDRGKAGQIRIDWTDRTKLRQVIYRRLAASTGLSNLTFEQLWGRFFIPQVAGKDSLEYFIDHCLMRPRFLLNIVEIAVANGINRGHALVNQDDCIDAVRQHSLYLINDFGYEIRDVSGLPSDILYSLVGATQLLTRDEVLERFRKGGVKDRDLDTAFRLMLWYGVLGVITSVGAERFIYDYDYDFQRLKAEIQEDPADVLFIANAALHVGLRI